jgi:ribosomal protein S1
VDSDSFDRYASAHIEGSKVIARVTRLESFGAFCELAPGVSGLLTVADMHRRMQFPEDYPKVGESLEVFIAYINKRDRKIRLSEKPLGGNA